MGMKRYRGKERWGEKMTETDREDGNLKLQKDGEENKYIKNYI